MLASMNLKEVMVVITFFLTVSLITTFNSEKAYVQHYQEQQHYINNQKGLQQPLSADFINPFRDYNKNFEVVNRLHSPPIKSAVPKNIEELIMSQMPPIPAVYVNLEDVNEDFRQQNNLTDLPVIEGLVQEHVPFFWHIPRTGGTTILQAFGKCLGRTLASSTLSIPYSSQSTPSFENIFHDTSNLVKVLRYEDSKYVNVNLNATDGMFRAKHMEILEQKDEHGRTLVDIVASPSIYEMSKILFATPEHLSASNPKLTPKGQLFSMFRHPVEREISYFYNLKNLHPPIQMQSDEEDLSLYELSDWIKSPFFVDNVMVRSIINNFSDSYEVSVQDFLAAKEVLRRKCLIGLLEEKASSWKRMREYYGWDLHSSSYGMQDSARYECEDKLLFWGWCNRNPHRPYVGYDSFDYMNDDDGKDKSSTSNIKGRVDKVSYEHLKILNRWDMLLYEYAKYLFQKQGEWLGDIVDKKSDEKSQD